MLKQNKKFVRSCTTKAAKAALTALQFKFTTEWLKFMRNPKAEPCITVNDSLFFGG